MSTPIQPTKYKVYSEMEAAKAKLDREDWDKLEVDWTNMTSEEIEAFAAAQMANIHRQDDVRRENRERAQKENEDMVRAGERVAEGFGMLYVAMLALPFLWVAYLALASMFGLQSKPKPETPQQEYDRQMRELEWDEYEATQRRSWGE